MFFSKEKIFIQVPYADLLTYLGPIVLLGWNCEIFVSKEALDVCRSAEIGRIRRAFKRRKLAKSIHGPVTVSRESDPEALRKHYARTIRLCRELEAQRLVTHIEYSSRRHPSVEQWVSECARFWSDIAALGEENGVTVLLENHTEKNPDAITGILRSVGSARLKACFDVGHYHAFGEREPGAFIDSYPEGAIAEVHLSDNRKDDDTHLPLGEGTLDFKSFFSALRSRGIDPYFVIEAKDAWGVFKGWRYLKKNLFQ